jgi:hypothetical protein
MAPLIKHVRKLPVSGAFTKENSRAPSRWSAGLSVQWPSLADSRINGYTFAHTRAPYHAQYPLKFQLVNATAVPVFRTRHVAGAAEAVLFSGACAGAFNRGTFLLSLAGYGVLVSQRKSVLDGQESGSGAAALQNR